MTLNCMCFWGWSCEVCVDSFFIVISTRLIEPVSVESMSQIDLYKNETVYLKIFRNNYTWNMNVK